MLYISLNGLHNHQDYHGFVMEGRGPKLNHLCFADDTMLLTLGRDKSLQLIMQTLESYEDTSGQVINCDKCHFMVHHNGLDSKKERIKRISGFKHKQGIITNIGCPLSVGRPRIS